MHKIQYSIDVKITKHCRKLIYGHTLINSLKYYIYIYGKFTDNTFNMFTVIFNNR